MQINNYWKVAVVINNMFRRQKTLKKKIIKLYSTIAHTALLYVSENWTRDARDVRRITAAETKYVSNTS
jgi:predicted nucleic acid-binding protein